MSDVLGLAELQTVLGRTKPTVLAYIKRRDFPAPVAKLERGRLWDRAEVEEWAARMLPLKVGRKRAAR